MFIQTVYFVSVLLIQLFTPKIQQSQQRKTILGGVHFVCFKYIFKFCDFNYLWFYLSKYSWNNKVKKKKNKRKDNEKFSFFFFLKLHNQLSVVAVILQIPCSTTKKTHTFFYSSLLLPRLLIFIFLHLSLLLLLLFLFYFSSSSSLPSMNWH